MGERKADLVEKINLDSDAERYKDFILQLRRRASSPAEAVDIPILLNPPSENLHSVFDVILHSDHPAYSLRVRIQRHDLYIIGYRDEHTTQWYEFNNARQRRLISEKLRTSVHHFIEGL